MGQDRQGFITMHQTGDGANAWQAYAHRLDRLAEVAVRVGLNLSPGQELIVSAPVEALPLVRLIAKHAYRAGATLVTPLFADGAISLARYQHGNDAIFDAATGWLYDGMAAAFRANAARLGITGEDPGLLAGEDASKISRASKAQAAAFKPAREYISRSDINWTVMSCATAGWAARVFPEHSPDRALEMLWDAVFTASRVDTDDPVVAWQTHNAELLARRAMLDSRRYASLRFRGPGTDLTVGLADGHCWSGGLTTAGNGISGNPNVPTEEVFTTPHALRVDGIVAATKPLSYSGVLIRDIAVRFEEGRVVEAQASTGLDVLEKLLDSDEGSRRLGEVALVPHSSPISMSGILFFNTLFDENAASHIALGQSYAKCIQDRTLDLDGLVRHGANQSLIHVDWMIGSDQVDVDGILPDGRIEPVMRQGEWA
jgi:aminopeptidase